MANSPTNGPNTELGETVSRLQRGVLRLALSFHGQNSELDKRLKELGVLIRSGKKNDKLHQLIDGIIDTIVSQEISQNSNQRGGRTLSDFISRLERRFPDSQTLSSVSTRLSLPLDRASFDRAIDDAATAIIELIDSSQSRGSGQDLERERQGIVNDLLDRIRFPAQSNAQIDEIKQRIRKHQDEVELMRNLDRVAAFISNELSGGGNADNFTRSRDQLLLLMNLIPFPADLADRSSKTRRTIENAETPEKLYECIPEIADLTGTMRAQLQAEINGLGEFLKDTLTRLQSFEVQIRRSANDHDESIENAFNLEKEVGSQSNGIRSDLEDADDIETIKAAVLEHLDNIDECLDRYVQVEAERHKQARERIDHMVSALNELEFEAKELRDSLEKQHAQVLIDPLTGILNRTGYDENIHKEYVRWKRYKSNLSVAVIDLDMFKDINDTYGHTAGDKVLATVARQIESQIRECDILCRYGGEEFVLVLPETSVDDGMVLLEKLRGYIEQCHFHFQQTPVPVTMSCGIAGFHQDDTIEDVFGRADQAMYLAKRSGRNQCRTEDQLREESA